MPNLIQKIGKIIGAPEKGALATSAVLLSLDLMGGSGLFSAAGAATGIAQSGIGKSLCEALKGAIGGYLPILFQNLENNKSARENHTNFKLFVSATENCLKDVRTWFLESYDLQKNLMSSQKDRSKAKRIFNEQIVDPFLTYFTEDRVAELFNENKQFSADQFVELAFQKSVNFRSPALMDYEVDKEIICLEFCSVFRKKFLDQIRIIMSNDAVLRDSYHTFLLHQILQAMNSTKGLESQLSEVLLTLKKQSGLELPPCSPEITDRLDALEKKNDQLLGQISGYIKAHQIPDLHYMLPFEEQQEMQLGFSYRYTGYVGRQDILIHLHDFMNQTDPLKWVMVAGKAGQGKSRIAQEICDVYYKKGWHVGFWPPRSDRSSFNWAQFTPGHFNGVLLVFDYIIGKEKEIKFILQRIALRMRELQAEQGNPGLVRVILLEREFSNDWLDSILMLDHVGDKLFSPDKILKPESKQLSNNNVPYFLLTGLENEDLIRLMSELLKKDLTTEEQDQLLNLLVAIDPEKRPLFAFILGLYIRENGITEELTQWNRIEQPLKYILAREERDWEKAPIWQRQSGLIGRTAIFMAALGQNLSLSKLLQTIGTYLKNTDPIEQDAIAQLFRSTSHYREGIRDSYCLGLQPDLLAEYYVIRHFLRLNDLDESALLLNSTFKIDPEMVTSMLVKTEQNFRHHSGFEAVLYWLKEMVLNASLDVEQARELSRLIYGFFQSNTPKETDRYNLPYILIFFEHLKHLQLSFPDDIELARTYTRSAHRYNYYFAAKKDPDPEQAFQYLLDYGVAMRGYQPFQTDPELALRQTTGARNVIYSLLVEKEKRSVDIFRCREIFETYIWELRKVDKFKIDREIQLETIKAIDLLVEGYTSRPISKPDQAVELINEYLDQLMNGEDFASDLAFAEFQLKCYYTLLYYYCYIDPQPSIKNGIHYYKKVAELFAKFKENDSIIQHRNLLQNLADTTSKFQRPPLWKKLENINGTNSLEKLNSDAILSDPTIWKIGEMIPIETWQKLYLPFLNQTPLYPDEQKLKNLLADAFEQSKYPPDIRYVKHIIGARAFKIPFYQNATLYQVLCNLDSWDRYLIGTGTRPGPGIGLINFIHAPGSSAGFYWLTGLSSPIHELNGHFNLHLDQPDLARDYLRYFCLMVQGESGSFTLMERIEDVFMIKSQENDIAEKKLTETLNQNIPKSPEFDPEENAWYSNHLIAFGSALFKVQMKTKTFGPIEMLDDDPLLGDLPICSIRFLEGLMYHFEPEEN